ncbi:general substrate transporter [Aspergillus pseudodeflectus]|uniref:General substrate transporter n=1 Tax=Aspergillus pseudodeflectus TaxID=176178 RepID=A0ABR4JMP6_9EURO
MNSKQPTEDRKSLDMAQADATHTEFAVESERATTQFGFAKWKKSVSAFRQHKRVSFWCIIIMMFLVNFGFDALISGQALAFPAFREDYGHYYAPADDYVVSALWQSLWSAANTLGIVAGSFIAGFTNDRLGRRFSFWANLVFSVVSSFALLFAPNVQTLFAAKLVFGVSVGLSYTTAPLYVAENAPSEVRGTLLSFFNMFVVLGQFLAVVVANPLSRVAGSWSYKGTFCMTLLIPSILIFLLPFLPESPVWYIMKGRESDARRAISRLHAPATAVRVDEIVAELKRNISRQTTANQDTQPGWLEIFKGGNLRRTVLVTILYSIAFGSGMPLVLNYQAYFYQLAGIRDAFAVALGSFALMLVGTLCSLVLPDIAGQRKVMLYGAALLIVWDLIIGSVGFAPAENRTAVIVTVAFVASWAFVYQLTIGTVVFVIAPEIPSQRLRAKTQAFGTIVANILGWGIAFAIPYLFNPDQANLGARLLLIFVGLGTPLTVYLWVYLPETRNRSLAELDEWYNRARE